MSRPGTNVFFLSHTLGRIREVNNLQRSDIREEYLILRTRKSKSSDKVEWLLKGICERTKVQGFSFHSLRHYGASHLAKEIVPLKDIQTLLRHQQATTTDIYLQSFGFASQLG